MLRIAAIVLAAIFAQGVCLRAAQITGRASLEGKPPPEKVVDFTDYPDVAKAYPQLVGKLTTRHYVVSEDGGLANVFVYVKSGLEGQVFPPATNSVVLDQTNAVFNPYVLGIRTQQTLIVRNSEPYLDAPQCESTNNKPFNFAQPITGMVSRHKFEKPEVLIRVKCGIHPWEFAFIGVVEHPFFAVTDREGRYSLPPGLPPGKYVIEAVHPKAGRIAREVTLAGDQTLTVDFTFRVPTARK
ncbi:MAG: carboxypeptidase-like regulatory domain-containing protein [Verrucomicrobiae bacterium]|nr:carboxypeptidase-like regulatory domain-containing protein [Verrucomicrobiae bacterium]